MESNNIPVHPDHINAPRQYTHVGTHKYDYMAFEERFGCRYCPSKVVSTPDQTNISGGPTCPTATTSQQQQAETSSTFGESQEYMEVFGASGQGEESSLSLGHEPGSRGRAKSIIYEGNKWIFRRTASFKNKLEFVNYGKPRVGPSYAVLKENYWTWFFPSNTDDKATQPATHDRSINLTEAEYLDQCAKGLGSWTSSFPLQQFNLITQHYAEGQFVFQDQAASAEENVGPSLIVTDNRPSSPQPGPSTSSSTGHRLFRHGVTFEELSSLCPPGRTKNPFGHQASDAASNSEEPPSKRILVVVDQQAPVPERPTSQLLVTTQHHRSQSFTGLRILKRTIRRRLEIDRRKNLVSTPPSQSLQHQQQQQSDSNSGTSSSILLGEGEQECGGGQSSFPSTTSTTPPPPTATTPSQPPPTAITPPLPTANASSSRKTNPNTNAVIRRINPYEANYFVTRMQRLGIILEKQIYLTKGGGRNIGKHICQQHDKASRCPGTATLDIQYDLTTFRTIKRHSQHALPNLRELHLPTSVKFYGFGSSGKPTWVITEDNIKFKFKARFATHVEFECERTKHCSLKFIEKVGQFFVCYRRGTHSQPLLNTKNQKTLLSEFETNLKKVQMEPKKKSNGKKDETIKKCQDCNFDFVGTTFKTHLKNKFQNGPFKCSLCCETFFKKNALGTHYNKKHIEQENIQSHQASDNHVGPSTAAAVPCSQEEEELFEDAYHHNSPYKSIQSPQLAPENGQVLIEIPDDIQVPIVKVGKTIKSLQNLVLESYRRDGIEETIQKSSKVYNDLVTNGKNPETSEGANLFWSAIPGAANLILYDVEKQTWKFKSPISNLENLGWTTACQRRTCVVLPHHSNSVYCRGHDPLVEVVTAIIMDLKAPAQNTPIHVKKIYLRDAPKDSDSSVFKKNLMVAVRNSFKFKQREKRNAIYRILRFDRFEGETRDFYSDYRLFSWKMIVSLRLGLSKLQELPKNKMNPNCNDNSIIIYVPHLDGSKIKICPSAIPNIPRLLEENGVHIAFMDSDQYFQLHQKDTEDFVNIRKISLLGRSNPVTNKLGTFFKPMLETDVERSRMRYWVYLIRFQDGAAYTGLHYGKDISTISTSHSKAMKMAVSVYAKRTRLTYTSTLINVEDTKMEAEVVESQVQFILLLAFANEVSLLDTFNDDTYKPITKLLNKMWEWKPRALENLNKIRQLAFRLTNKYMSYGPVPDCSTLGQLSRLIQKDDNLDEVEQLLEGEPQARSDDSDSDLGEVGPPIDDDNDEED